MKGQMTGMFGVYQVAAELTRRGFIVSGTSRGAFGADLLITDQRCQTAWSVQVKTNAKPAGFWLCHKNAGELKSNSHVYVFVNVQKGGDKPSDFYIVPSKVVARYMKKHHPSPKPSGPGRFLPPLCFNALAQLNLCGRRSRSTIAAWGHSP